MLAGRLPGSMIACMLACLLAGSLARLLACWLRLPGSMIACLLALRYGVGWRRCGRRLCSPPLPSAPLRTRQLPGIGRLVTSDGIRCAVGSQRGVVALRRNMWHCFATCCAAVATCGTVLQRVALLSHHSTTCGNDLCCCLPHRLDAVMRGSQCTLQPQHNMLQHSTTRCNMLPLGRACSGTGKTVVHDNHYYTSSGKVRPARAYTRAWPTHTHTHTLTHTHTHTHTHTPTHVRADPFASARTPAHRRMCERGQRGLSP